MDVSVLVLPLSHTDVGGLTSKYIQTLASRSLIPTALAPREGWLNHYHAHIAQVALDKYVNIFFARKNH